MDNCKKEENTSDQSRRSEAAKNMERFLRSINATDRTAERLGKATITFAKKTP